MKALWRGEYPFGGLKPGDVMTTDPAKAARLKTEYGKRVEIVEGDEPEAVVPETIEGAPEKSKTEGTEEEPGERNGARSKKGKSQDRARRKSKENRGRR
jgi:hypothetical protein